MTSPPEVGGEPTGRAVLVAVRHSRAIGRVVKCPDGWTQTREEALRPLSEAANPVKQHGLFATLRKQLPLARRHARSGRHNRAHTVPIERGPRYDIVR
jgi:hypothetical protein